MATCRRCGEENPDRARFCLACAAPLAAPAAARREERKRVSVLFCDLVGFTSRAEQLDIEDVRGVLAPYYARLRAALERHGGTVEKFIGDAVMALFGAPTAHEDDPERAVRAALAIREMIEDLNRAEPSLDLHVRIGVTTGEALVVLDARPAEGEGMASGDVVNTAARLQSAAPVDGVLVDQTTYQATDRQIVYRPAEPVQAKGKTELVVAWSAVEGRASLGVDVDHGPGTALVGREREVGVLRAALGRVRDEQAPQLVTLVGVPGMGKSRLVWELAQLVEAEPELIVWRQGRCLAYGEGVALWALGEVVKAQAGILDSDQADEAEAKLAASVAMLVADAGEVAWVTGHLRPLIGLLGGLEVDGDHREEAFAGWRRFLEAVAEQGPAVLVVEDLHWADELLLDFLDHLVDWAAEVPLLVVATARPELLARRPGWGGGKPNSAIVSLAPLSDQDTARLVAGLLEQALLPAELQATLLARAGGNPLYAEEYVRMLADRGFLRKVGGTWRLEQGEELPLPESVEGIIGARLDALSVEEKALLQDAAVLGKVGWFGALAALSGSEPSTVERHLHALERRELLRRERRSAVAGERQYAFRHVLIRDVAYSQLPRAARAGKHRRAALWLQVVSPDRAEDRAELLAHHWRAALEYAQAAGQDTGELAGPARQAMRDAGDQALRLHALAAAGRWYEAALELWPVADPERPRLLLQLGRVCYWTDDARTGVLAEARDGLLAQGDREAAAEAHSMLAYLLGMDGTDQESIVEHRRAAAMLEAAGPSRSKAFVLAHLAGALALAGHSRETIEAGSEGIAVAEALGLDSEGALARSFVGSARVAIGDSRGLADLERAAADAFRADSPYSSIAAGNLGNAAIVLGDLARGFELQAKGRRAAERFRLPGELRWLQTEQIFEDYWRGRWDAAMARADELLGEADAEPGDGTDDNCRFVRALIRLASGDPAGALADTAAFSGVAVDNPQSFSKRALRARTLLVSGAVGEASARADELLAALAAHNALATNPDWTGQLAVVLQALGRGGELVELLSGVAPTPWLQAGMAIADGAFQRAADLYATIGSLPDEAYARLRAAQQLFAGGLRSEAREQLHRAVAFYRGVRATGYLLEGEELLGASA